MRAIGAGTVLALLAAGVDAGELSTAREQIRRVDVAARKAAIETLVRLDSRASLDVLVSALRRAYRDDDRQSRAYRKVMTASIRRLGALTQELEESKEELESGSGLDNVQKTMEDLARITKLAAKEARKAKAATERLAPHLAVTVRGTAALSRFTAPDAVARLEELAMKEPSGRLRFACLGAVRQRGSPAVVPTLLDLTQDRDPRVRALAVRGLEHHVAEPGVADRLTACTEDECWQVRRGACASLAAAAPDTAVAILEEARERETGDDRRRIEAHLNALGRGDGPPPAPAVAFGLPLTSRRVRFVFHLPNDLGERVEYVKQEMRKVIEQLPEGASFEVVALSAEELRFTSRPATVTPGARRRALSWLARLEPSGPDNTHRLFELVAPSYDHPARGKRVFPDLPDAVYLVCHDLDTDAAVRGVASFLLWNDACDAVLHVCSLSRVALPPQLRKLAEKTGGTFVSK